MKVKELMNPHVWSVQRHAPLTEAARQMWDQDIGCLPVVDEWNHVIAVVTDRDILMCTHLRGRPLAELEVADCMSAQVFTCQPDDDIEVAAGSMRLHQVRRIPVIDESDRLMGLISLNDIGRAAFNHPDRSARKKLVEEAAQTLAIISQPRRRNGEDEAIVELKPASGAPEERVAPPRAAARAR